MVRLDYKNLSREEETKLIVAAKKGESAARDKLILSHIKLCHRVARQTGIHDLADLDEAVSEGCLGMLRALETFDVSLGYRFNTHAVTWIKNYIMQYLTNKVSTLHISQTRETRILQHGLRRFAIKHAARYGSSTYSEFVEHASKHFGIDPAIIEKFMVATSAGVSFDTPIHDDVDLTLGDVIEDVAAISEADVINGIDNDIRAVHLRNALSNLTPRERAIVIARHTHEQTPTLSELSAKMGISRERVRQIDVKTLSKLRLSLRGCPA